MGIVRKRLGGLVALGAAVGAGYAYLRHDEATKTKREQAALDESKLLHCPKLAHVVEVELTGPAGTVALARRAAPAQDANATQGAGVANGEVQADRDARTLQRGDDEGVWTLTVPLSAPADQSTVQALLQSACALAQRGNALVLDAPSEAANANAPAGATPLVGAAPSAKAFGLMPPRATLRLRYLDGGNEVLEFGDKSSFDDTLYVRRRGEAALRRVDGAFAFQIERDAFSLREKRLVDFESAEVVRLAVHLAAQEPNDARPDYTLIHQEAGYCLQSGARAHPADEMAAHTLLSALSQIRAKRFVEEAPDAPARKRYGLQRPHLTADVARQGGAQVQVRIGRLQLGEGKHFFAQVGPDTAPIAELPSGWLVDKLAEGARELRDMHVMQLDPAEVATIVVREGFHAGAKEITLARRGAVDVPLSRRRFVLVDDKGDAAPLPAGKQLAQDRVRTTLGKLAELRADAFVEGPTNAAVLHKAFLDAPLRTVRFADTQGKVLGVLNVGKAEGAHTAVLGNRDPQVAYVFTAALEGIDAEPASWLETAAPAATP